MVDHEEEARPPVVGIGASAGGLEAIREFFSGFGGDTDLAFVVIQHLDPNHESLMAELIERYTPMAVTQARGGERLEANHVYVIPPGHGLAVVDGVLQLTEFTDPRGMRRPIDDFFESLAQDSGPEAACVILSGTGADGSRGLRAIKEQGGLCVAQAPGSARYDGMPSSAIGTGLVDFVDEPRHLIAHVRRFLESAADTRESRDNVGSIADSIDDLCDLVHSGVGHDFSGYKRSTLSRRIARRMQVLGIDDPAGYAARIRDDESECAALFRDLLINVTRFFRDADDFEALAANVIDGLVRRARDAEEIRVWVPGCSSGEEAYTLAILFAEAMRRHGVRPFVQIFATDIDDKMLGIAKRAEYPLAALHDIPAPFRDRYTMAGTGSFTLVPAIRDMVRFSEHSLIKDPPYSKIALLSCRNLLIYLDDALQKRIIPVFHFALREGGTLFLGSSESIGRFDDLFETVDQKARIFRRRSVATRYSIEFPTGARRVARPRGGASDPGRHPHDTPSEIRALKRLAEAYAPVSLMVDAEGTLLDRWGRVGRYLDFPERMERTIHVPSLARPGLREVMGGLLREARAEGRRMIARDVRVDTEFGHLPCTVICEPVDERAFLFVIREDGGIELHDQDEFAEFDRDEGQIKFLEEELQSTRFRLRSTVEELETTNEELKSSNEEMMSMNEELQSTNEELTTVNDELKTKVDQFTIANADLKNFFASTELLVLVVDEELNVRTFTEAAKGVFDLGPAARGRPLAELGTSLAESDFVRLASDAAGRGQSGERRVRTADDKREFILRALPYRRLDGSVDGATLVLTDVTHTLEIERALAVERQRLQLALEVARIGIWEYEPSTDTVVLDETERQLLDVPEDDPGESMNAILARLDREDRDRINTALRRSMDGLSDFNEVFRIELRKGGTRWLHGLGRRIEGPRPRKFIGVTYDVTAERQQLQDRELLIREMNHRVKNLFAVIAGMVSASAREAEDKAELAERLRERIGALGRSHALATTGSDGVAPDLERLMRTVLAPSVEAQDLSLSGPEVRVVDGQLTPLALILHEWATNSAKYGALSVQGGSIDVRWTAAENGVSIEWSERGGDGGAGDGRAGFGSRLMEASARQLSGEIEGDVVEGGFRRRLRYPT